ncbi:MAG: hypothetical protein KIT31_16355 [Deltaproteobacteria bacterium]|nr:hypothetical protein [Deltaproteobacteria bacterium]
MWLCGAVACHGGHAQPDAGDQTPDAIIDAGADGGLPIDAAPDAMLDAGVDGGMASGIEVAAVATDDGFTEVRQGATTEHLVISGSLLADVAQVMVGSLPCAITATTAAMVQCDLDVPHGHAPGALSVMVTSPTLGVAVAPNPITITFVTVAPNAAPGGRGTHQSPLSLCEIGSIDFGGQTFTGDTVDLLAGTHTCAMPIGLTWGVDIRGAGVGTTLIAPGFGGFSIGFSFIGDPNATTHVTGLSVDTPAGTVVQLDTCCGGNPGLVVDELSVTGGASSAVAVAFDFDAGGPPVSHRVEIEHLTYDAAGRAIDVPSSHGTIQNTTIKHCATGIRLEYRGAFDITGLTIEDCTTGVVLERPDAQSIFDSTHPVVTFASSQIRAGVGIWIDSGDVAGTVAITATGLYGAVLTNGRLLVTGSQITATDTAVMTSSIDGDSRVSVEIDQCVLVGGRVGIEYASPDGGALHMHGTRAEGGAFGLIVGNTHFTSSIEISGNQLIGAVFAYRDEWDQAMPFGIIQAFGTTLNGNSYAGQTIVGPTQLAPDYQIIHTGATTRF